MNTKNSTKITLWINRLLAVALVVLAFELPTLLDWYMSVRSIGTQVVLAIAVGYYCCLPVVGYALWCIDRLMKNILSGQVFVVDNVRRIRRVRWCCAGVSLICLPAAWFYPPLIFMAVIMGFMALILSVVKNVIAAAVEIREENDLTV